MRQVLRTIAAMALQVSFAIASCGAALGQSPTAAGPSETSGLQMAFSVVPKLAIVLSLAYVIILALRVLSAKRQRSPAGQYVKVVDTVGLSQTNSLRVVSSKGKQMLVGCPAGQVSLLREFVETEQPEADGTTGTLELDARN